jgi:ribonuclease-3
MLKTMTDIPSLKKYFKDKKLLTQALTHKSWVNENHGMRESNERLEFLGDAVLELIVSQKLFEKFPKKEEGYLTTLRANLVNTVNLAKVATNLNVGEALFLSKGEEEGKGRMNTSLLADTVEAIIGALYVDQSMDSCVEFIEKNILNDLANKVKEPLKDAKSRLQELVQAQGLSTPKYKVIKETGPDHSKVFVTEVVIDDETKGLGKGPNKSIAAQNAAAKALENL